MTTRLPTDVVEARLNHLIDRARRGALLPDEADRFTTELRDLVRRLEDTEDDRARAETRAEQAEAAIERVRQLHQPAPGGSGGLSFNSGDRCAACDHPYRCDTIRTLDQAQQPTT